MNKYNSTNNLYKCFSRNMKHYLEDNNIYPIDNLPSFLNDKEYWIYIITPEFKKAQGNRFN